MATLGKTTITDLNVLNDIKENNTSLVDKYTTLGTTQTISGKKTFSNGLNITGGCDENKNMPFFLGIDAFNNGGAVKWITNSDVANAIGSVSKNYSYAQAINGKANCPLILNNTTDPTTSECGLAFQIGGTSHGWVGAHSNGYTYLYTYTGGHKLGIKTDGSGFIDNSTIITTSNIGSQTSGYATKLTLNPTGLAEATYGNYEGIIQSTSGTPEGETWCSKLKILHNNSLGYYTELAQSFTDGRLYYRSLNAGTLNNWKKVLNSDDSVSKIGKYTSVVRFDKNDNSGLPTLMLISDITPIYNLTSGGTHYGFVGSFIHSRTSGIMREGVGNLIARIGYAWNQRVLTTEDSYIVPCIISYNSKYYIALKLSGSGHGFELYGYFLNKLSEFIELKYTSGTALPSGVTMIEEGTVLADLSLTGGTMKGDIVMGGVNASQSINTKSKIIWGTGATISSNGNNVIINPTSSTTTGQIIMTPGGYPSITVNGTKVSLEGHTHDDVSYLKGLGAVTNNIDNLGVADKLSFACYSNTEDTNFPLTGKDGLILTAGWANNIGYKAQLALDDNGYNVAFRYNPNTEWQPWKKLSFEGHTHTFTGTAHKHTITPSGTVSSTFTGKAVTSGATTAGGNVSSTFTGTAHNHTASLSGSVTSGVLTISVSVDNTTAGGNVSSTFTGTSHTHSVTANGTISSTFTGTSSQSTSSVTATGTIG